MTLIVHSATYIYLQSPLMSSPQEAEYALEVADAKRETCHAERLLAECQMREAILQVRLYRIRLERAQDRLNEANRNVGRVRHSVRKSGHFAVLKRTNDLDVHTRVHQYKRTSASLFPSNDQKILNMFFEYRELLCQHRRKDSRCRVGLGGLLATSYCVPVLYYALNYQLYLILALEIH